MSNGVIGLKARPPLLYSVLGLLLVAYAWPVWLQYEQFGRITAMEATIRQQTAILEQALGTALPVKMPPEWESRLEELEAVVEDPGQWPQSTSDAEEFVEKLSQLILELSPLSEASYFPRLSLVRWAAVAFDGLHTTPAVGDPLDNLADRIRAIADASPEGVVLELEQKLRETADELARRAEDQLIEANVQMARRYFTDEETSEVDIPEIYEILGLYEDNPQRGDEIRELRSKLQELMTKHEAQRQAATLNGQWAKAKALAASQPSIYETAANMLLREVTAARTVLALQGIQQSDYDNLEDEIRRAVEEIQDKARRGYQRWALTQIVKFENKHKAISAEAEKNARIFSIDNGGWNNERFIEVRYAMTTYLLPIDRALLDLPVLKRYQRTFDEGWNRLDGRKDQTNVAIESALVRKRNYHNFE